MSPLWKLALRLLGVTVLGLAAVGGFLVQRLARDTPPPTHPEIFPQLGHSNRVLSVSWSPDGRTIASGSEDTTLKLWDASSGTLLRTLSGHSSSVSSVSWSPDGRTVVSGSEDTTLKLWDASSGTLLRTLPGHSSSVWSVSWSPDGRTVASGSGDTTLKLWDASSGTLLRTLPGHSSSVSSVSWSPDSRTVVSGSWDNTLKLWDASSGNLLRTLFGHSDSVWSVAWSPNGQTVASGSEDNTLKLWDASSGTLLRTLLGHSSRVVSVAWSPDGRSLASGSSDNTLKLWDASSDTLPRTLSDHSSRVVSVAWSPDGRSLASGSDDTTLKLWDASSGTVLRTFSGYSSSVSSVAWSPDGRTIASASSDKTIKLWEASSGNLLRTLSDPNHSPSVSSVAWSPDSRAVAWGNEDNTLKLWDASSGELPTLRGHSSSVWSVAWSPDARTVASGSSDKTIKLWEASSGNLLRTLPGHSDMVRSVAWSPDSRTVVSGSWDNTLKLWDASSGKLLHTLSGHRDSVWSVSWSPDGRTVASSSDDKTIKLWDAAKGELLQTLEGHSDRVRSVAWSPDGRTIASGSDDKTLKLWDASSGTLLLTLSGHSDRVRSVAWSPDGRHLVSGHLDGSMALWQSTGNLEWLALALPGTWLTYHPTRLFYAASPDGDELAAIRFDSRTSPVYPLTYYRQELRRSALSPDSSQAPPPIKPKPLRREWDRFENKATWLTVSFMLYWVGFALVLVLAHRKHPLTLAQRFFASVGATRIQRISENLLSLSKPSVGQRAYVLLWEAETSALPQHLLRGKGASDGRTTVYVLYTGKAPETARDQLHERLSCEVIPISTETASIALSEGASASVLRGIEDRFSIRIDPYDESKPVDDPTEFQGREDLIERLAMALKQGQHVGLFGLRKVGKTSLIKQLRNRAQDTPVVYIDCQASGSAASGYFQMILDKLRTEFERLRVPQLPSRKGVSSPEDFREEFLRLTERWLLAGRSGPFLVLLDEIDKLFVDRRREGSDQILGEYVRLLRPLRAMAQEHRCLAVLATSYRADVNRQNALTPSVGENPMFMSFQEYFLGAFTPEETRSMVVEIGAWKGIRWDSEALDAVQDLCGGHPYLTRALASDACDRGTRHHVSLDKVRTAAQVIQSDYAKHKIGQYYKEAIWNELREDERQALELIAREDAGLTDAAPPRELKEAFTQIELYGLVHRADGRLQITARLLRQWIAEREYA